jgi:DNA-binding MarR family transcriptional regulator
MRPRVEAGFALEVLIPGLAADILISDRLTIREAELNAGGDRSEQQRLAVHLYGQAMAIIDPIRVKMWNEAELTTGQLRILFMVRSEPGVTLGQIARNLQVSPPTASGLVDRLAKLGYLRREEDAADRRYVRHQLTEAGAATVGEVEREAGDLLDAILARLSDADLETLIHGLTKLSAAAATATQDAGEKAAAP